MHFGVSKYGGGYIWVNFNFGSLSKFPSLANLGYFASLYKSGSPTLLCLQTSELGNRTSNVLVNNRSQKLVNNGSQKLVKNGSQKLVKMGKKLVKNGSKTTSEKGVPKN